MEYTESKTCKYCGNLGRVDKLNRQYNVAYEVDEPHHVYTELKDFIREENIKKEIKCEFMRIRTW